MLLTAGLALPMDGRPPIRDAAVLIEGARIAAVGARRGKLARFDALVATAEGQVQAAGDPGLRVGLSPHAPYSIVGRMIGHVAERARDAGMPLAMHLAESAGEVALLRDGTGVIAEFIRAGLAESRGEPPDYYREGGHGLGPIAYAAARGLFAP